MPPTRALVFSRVSPRISGLPSCPNGVYVHSLRNINYQLDVCIVVVVRTTRNLPGVNCVLLKSSEVFHLVLDFAYLDVLVRHSDVVSVCL